MKNQNAVLDETETTPETNRLRCKATTQAQLQWGAFDEGGNLRAILGSESEAYHYVQNRGHMHGGSYRKVETIAHAERLAEALKFVKAALSQPVMRQRTRTVPEKATAFLILRGDCETAITAIDAALAQWEGSAQ